MRKATDQQTSGTTSGGKQKPPIMFVDPACPYCRVVQDPFPQRREKCRDCGQVIYTYTDRKARKRYLLTAEEAEAKAREKAFWMIENAKSLQRVAKELQWDGSEHPQSDLLLFSGKFLAEPILLSLAIEIALKAWQCREGKKEPEKIHDLLKLFDGLESSTQDMLEAKMRKLSPHSVRAEEPSMQNLNSDQQDMLGARMHPLRDVLCSHRDEHTHWRYLYEDPSSQFETSEIDRALTVIIDAYDER